MGVALRLDTMSIEDKIRTMEDIWEDLIKRADSISSPDWHKSVLEQREKSIKGGKDSFLDWDAAKKKINDSIS